MIDAARRCHQHVLIGDRVPSIASFIALRRKEKLKTTCWEEAHEADVASMTKPLKGLT
jgi:hypothetical protein